MQGALPYAKPALLINAASGSTDDIREPARRLASEFGLDLRAEYLQPDAIADTVDEIFADGCDLFISYGGDGTSRASGERAARKGVPFVPLPGGTMNMLPKLLYGDVPWDHALKQALMSGERWQPRGEMNGHSFFCGGFVGKLTRVNEAREELRDGGVGDAIAKLGDVIADVEAEDRLIFGPPEAPTAHRANLINIQMPGMHERVPTGSGIEIAGAAASGAADIAGLLAKAATSDWRHSDNAVSLIVREASITHPDNCPHVLLDGEPIDMDCPLSVTLIDEGVRVLARPLPPGTVRVA